MKKKAALFLTAIITAVSAGTAFAADGIIKDGHTLVPVRGVFESFGFKVNWEEESATAYIHADKVIAVERGQNFIMVGDIKIYPDVPQQIIDGHFYLPLRAVGDAIGAKTDWDADTKTAVITYNGIEVKVDCGDKPTAEENTPAEVSLSDVYAAYAKVLEKESYMNFELVYIDNDDIPELLGHNDGRAIDVPRIYTYYNGEAVFVDNRGAYGCIAYAEKQNRIYGYTGADDDGQPAEHTYMIEDGKLVKASDYSGYKYISSSSATTYKNDEKNRELLAKGELTDEIK